MAVLREKPNPQEKPQQVRLQDRTKRFLEDNFKPEAQVIKQRQQQQQAQELQEQATTGPSVQQSIKRGQASAEQAPELQPGQRVKYVDDSIADPRHFKGFYNQLDSIVNIAQQQRMAAEARSAYKRMQSFQDVLGQQAPNYNPQQLNRAQRLSINEAVKRSAPLRMLGSVAANAEQAAREISGRYGISNIGGHAKSGHIPGSDHYTGKAIDVMLEGRDGQHIVNYALNNVGRLGVKYIIYNRRYWDPRQGWTRYTGSNPHTGHVHISFR